MFNLLNLVYMGVVAFTSIQLYADEHFYFPPERDAVVEISAHREWWRSDGDCKFTGLMVPFVRDWAEEIDHGYDVEPTILPPEPDKTAGHAFLINEKVCEGKEPEAMLAVSEWHIVRHGFFSKNMRFQARNILALNQEERPKWYDQVIARIERVAETSPVAAAFLADTESIRLAANEATDSKSALQLMKEAEEQAKSSAASQSVDSDVQAQAQENNEEESFF